MSNAKKKTTIYLSQEDLDKLGQLGKELDRSVSWLVGKSVELAAPVLEEMASTRKTVMPCRE